MIGELEHSYELLDGMLPGTWAIGAGYSTNGEVSGMAFDPAHGYLFQLEQLVYRECACDEDDTQGLAVFAGYYPRFRSGRLPAESVGDSFVAGLVYEGLIPGRDQDAVGAGVAWAELFQGGTHQESVFEFFYKVQIAPRVSIQPDLQYIASPSRIFRDALAVGMRFQITL